MLGPAYPAISQEELGLLIPGKTKVLDAFLETRSCIYTILPMCSQKSHKYTIQQIYVTLHREGMRTTSRLKLLQV